jgi:hypothetical protein
MTFMSRPNCGRCSGRLTPFSHERLREALARAPPAVGAADAGRGEAGRTIERGPATRHVVDTNRDSRRRRSNCGTDARLDPRRFIRIHRSFVLTLDRVVRLERLGTDRRVAVLRDGSAFP